MKKEYLKPTVEIFYFEPVNAFASGESNPNIDGFKPGPDLIWPDEDD